MINLSEFKIQRFNFEHKFRVDGFYQILEIRNAFSKLWLGVSH